MKKENDVSDTARLVRHGAYQYVLLPKGFEFDGDRVRISRQGATVVLEPSEPVTPTDGPKKRNRALSKGSA